MKNSQRPAPAEAVGCTMLGTESQNGNSGLRTDRTASHADMTGASALTNNLRFRLDAFFRNPPDLYPAGPFRIAFVSTKTAAYGPATSRALAGPLPLMKLRLSVAEKTWRR